MPIKNKKKKGFEAEAVLNRDKTLAPGEKPKSNLPEKSLVPGVAPNVTRPKSEEFVATSEDVKRRMEFKNLREIGKILDTGGHKVISPEEIVAQSELAEQQTTERQNLLDEQLSTEKQIDSMTRLAQAGLIPFSSASNFIQNQLAKIGIKTESVFSKPEELAQTTAGKVIGVPVGYALNLKAFGFSLADLFQYNRDNAKEMASDATNLASNARLEVTNVKSRGADLTQALINLGKIEEAIRVRYNDAALSLKKSPIDVAGGIDYQDEMFTDLNKVVGYRQVLERYQLTGNFTELQNFPDNEQGIPT